MIVSICHILPQTILRKQRILPVPGRVLARQGQKVGALDVIAEAHTSPEHIQLNLSRSLRVPAKTADELTQCRAGDNIGVGDIIAGPVGISRRVVRSPINGLVQATGKGKVLIQVDRPPFELHAGVRGKVIRLIPDFGAVIETRGCQIQGSWGNGLEDYGLMQVKIDSPTDDLTLDQINISLRGSIILGGYCKDPEILYKAADVPIRGLILTSMSSKLINEAKRMKYPILVLEGFGKLHLNSITYNLLLKNQNREISLLANPFNRYEDQRPEIIIPLPVEEVVDEQIRIDKFVKGQKVRISSKPYQAETGTIELLYNDPVTFPSGIRTSAAKINLDKGTSVKVPLNNMEIIA